MTSSSAHSSSFVHRWLSRSSNATTNYDSNSKVESLSTNSFSPPPLTDSSSTRASSTILTPRTSIGRFPAPLKSSRYAVGTKPSTPPTTNATLPVVPTRRKVAFSLPVNSQPPLRALVTQTHVKLHRLLSHDPMRHTLNFDISLPSSFTLQNLPSASTSAVVVRKQLIHPPAISPPQPIPEHDLVQFATTPPVTRMKIMTDLIPWSINVRGRTTLPNDPKSFVRVVDVLDGIYKSLRAGVLDEEWNRVPKSFRDQVKQAYLRRCRASRPFTLTGYEEKQGVRRVDYFKDRTLFLGLAMKVVEGEGDSIRSVDIEECTWVMMLARRPS